MLHKNHSKSNNQRNHSLRLLRWFCPDHLYEEIEGDLIQKFNRDVKTFGESRAQRKLMWNVLRFFRPGIVLRNNLNLNLISMLMFRNNFTMAFRQIRKDSVFSSITLFGLSVSMAACLLIFQYSMFELSYDQQQPNTQDLYRVATITYEDGEERYQSALTATSVSPTLKESLPEVVESTRLIPTSNWFDCTLAYTKGQEIRIFNEGDKGFYFADPSFISMFNYPLLRGSKETALKKPFSIILSSTAAKKYFGSEEALGKTLQLRGSFQSHDYTVTGVMADPPFNSHLNVTIVASISSLQGGQGLAPFDTYTYVQLQRGTTIESLTNKIHEISLKMIPIVNKTETKFNLQPITDIHLHSSLQDEIKPGGNAKSIYFLLLVAIVVLVIAWINYVNLTTSRSVSRSKEVGIRKVNGATRAQIVYQFLTETFVFNLLGLGCATLIVYFFASYFYEFIGLSFPFDTLSAWNNNITTYLVLFTFLVCVLLSGFFPALIISSFNPVKVLKGRWKVTTNVFSFRKATVVFQFACAITLTIAVVTFNRQFKFMQQQDLGVEIKKSIILKAPSNVDSTYIKRLSGFKNQLKSLAIVHSISTSTGVPGKSIDWTGEVKKENDDSSKDFRINVIDPDFIESYKLKLLAGRNFEMNDFPRNHFGNKIEPVILNRTGVAQLGYKRIQDAIGESLFWGKNKCLVVGVVDDFHQESLKKSIQPILFTANMGPSMTIKLTEGADNYTPQSLVQIQKAWNLYFPNNPFDYFFLEDAYNKQYASDEQIAMLFHFFCLLALLISCLGLFALSLFSVSQRTKEISIRKVLGASSIHLIRLLTNEYLFLILIATAVALPLSYLGVNQWLQEFAFHIEVSVWFLVIPVILILIVALLTVGAQTIKVVIRNPTDSLKHE
jgi:putative ABC transport system permease protein